MARLSLLPKDNTKQAVRIRRFFLASSFSFLYLLVLYVFHLQGFVDRQTLIDAGVLICSLVGIFYLAFRSGLNLRMPDPSLTAPQLLSAVLTMAYMMYRAPATRVAFGAFLFIAFMFGMLRLPMRQLGWLAATALAAFAFVIALRFGHDEVGEIVKQDLIQWMILALTMPWFIHIGGYVRTLHKDLADASVRLEDVEEQARRDELTGAFNRRGVFAALEAEKKRCDRSHDVFCVCIIDIDFFKHVNDELGHLGGDEVLKRFVCAVQEGMRSTDVFGRYGGEEFVQILTHTTLEGGVTYADHIRSKALDLDLSGFGKISSITVSIGVAQYESGESAMQTFAHADAALYDAKRAGRNRVVAWKR